MLNMAPSPVGVHRIASTSMHRMTRKGHVYSKQSIERTRKQSVLVSQQERHNSNSSTEPAGTCEAGTPRTATQPCAMGVVVRGICSRCPGRSRTGALRKKRLHSPPQTRGPQVNASNLGTPTHITYRHLQGSRSRVTRCDSRWLHHHLRHLGACGRYS